MGKLVLIVEDEKSIRKLLRVNLEREGYVVIEAENGEIALEIAREENIDLVVLDLMLPGIGGYQVSEKLRNRYPEIGIIMLTAKSQDIDKITGLEYGADDYITKPFNPRELILRMKSIARRMGNKEELDLEFEPFKIDSYSKKFFKLDKEIKLTPTEYDLIKLFIRNPGRAFTRDELLNIIWGYDFLGDTKIVDVNIRRLRTKIEENPSEPQYIETVWGVGYRWINR